MSNINIKIMCSIYSIPTLVLIKKMTAALTKSCRVHPTHPELLAIALT